MFGIKRDLFQVKRKTDKTPEEIKLSAHHRGGGMGKGNVQTDQEHVRAETCKMIIRHKCTIRLQRRLNYM